MSMKKYYSLPEIVKARDKIDKLELYDILYLCQNDYKSDVHVFICDGILSAFHRLTHSQLIQIEMEARTKKQSFTIDIVHAGIVKETKIGNVFLNPSEYIERNSGNVSVKFRDRGIGSADVYAEEVFQVKKEITDAELIVDADSEIVKMLIPKVNAIILDQSKFERLMEIVGSSLN